MHLPDLFIKKWTVDNFGKFRPLDSFVHWTLSSSEQFVQWTILSSQTQAAANFPVQHLLGHLWLGQKCSIDKSEQNCPLVVQKCPKVNKIVHCPVEHGGLEHSTRSLVRLTTNANCVSPTWPLVMYRFANPNDRSSLTAVNTTAEPSRATVLALI